MKQQISLFNKNKRKILWQIFIASLKIAFLSFGGGNAAVGLIEKEFSQRYNWIDKDEFHKVVVLSNILPGTVIIKICCFIAKKVGGKMGFLICFVTILFPGPLILVLSLKMLYVYVPEEDLIVVAKAILPVVMAMLAAYVIEIFIRDREKKYNLVIYSIIILAVGIAMMAQVDIAIIFLTLIAALAIFRPH